MPSDSENSGSTQQGFDPYEKWLKIPSNRRPPSHCDLLGLPEGETDEHRIKDATAERYECVRIYADTKHADAAQRILEEIANARNALLKDVGTREKKKPSQEATETETPRRSTKSQSVGAAAGNTTGTITDTQTEAIIAAALKPKPADATSKNSADPEEKREQDEYAVEITDEHVVSSGDTSDSSDSNDAAVGCLIIAVIILLEAVVWGSGLLSSWLAKIGLSVVAFFVGALLVILLDELLKAFLGKENTLISNFLRVVGTIGALVASGMLIFGSLEDEPTPVATVDPVEQTIPREKPAPAGVAPQPPVPADSRTTEDEDADPGGSTDTAAGANTSTMDLPNDADVNRTGQSSMDTMIGPPLDFEAVPELVAPPSEPVATEISIRPVEMYSIVPQLVDIIDQSPREIIDTPVPSFSRLRSVGWSSTPTKSATQARTPSANCSAFQTTARSRSAGSAMPTGIAIPCRACGTGSSGSSPVKRTTASWT